MIYKVSCNSDNIFNLRKEPDKLRNQIYNRLKESQNSKFIKYKYIYEYQILNELFESKKEILFGRLIKYQKNKEVEKWDEKQKKIITVVSENDITDKVYFYYEKEKEYLIIEDRSQLDILKFKEVMTYLINYNNTKFKIDMNSILCDEELKRRIHKFKRITWAHFEIIPNNPNGKIWSNFEMIGERINSTSSTFDFKNKEKGLSYNQEMEELVDDVHQGRGRRYIIGGKDKNNRYNEVRSDEHIKRYYKNIDASEKGRSSGLWEITKEILDL